MCEVEDEIDGQMQGKCRGRAEVFGSFPCGGLGLRLRLRLRRYDQSLSIGAPNESNRIELIRIRTESNNKVLYYSNANIRVIRRVRNPIRKL
jgi:hypothetical protein